MEKRPGSTNDKIIFMIKSIIEEAMEKQDRIVNIHINGLDVSVEVTPLRTTVNTMEDNDDWETCCDRCVHRCEEAGEEACEQCIDYDMFEDEGTPDDQ